MPNSGKPGTPGCSPIDLGVQAQPGRCAAGWRGRRRGATRTQGDKRVAGHGDADGEEATEANATKRSGDDLMRPSSATLRNEPKAVSESSVQDSVGMRCTAAASTSSREEAVLALICHCSAADVNKRAQESCTGVKLQAPLRASGQPSEHSRDKSRNKRRIDREKTKGLQTPRQGTHR